MSMTQLDRVHYLNLGLIVLSCALAYVFPYYLLVFSYAVLGPAHYLTQISWLHDRRYFTDATYTPGVLGLLTLAALFSFGWVNSFLLMTAVFIALALVLPLPPSRRRWALAAAVLAAAVLSRLGPVALFVSLLLPTVIHVYIFTACFMLSGAVKECSRSSYAAIAALFLCGLSFALAPSQWYVFDAMPAHPGVLFFEGVARYLGALFGGEPHAGITPIFGFLSFAYTYHYLNWFSKTRIIQWHRISRGRLGVIVVGYAFALSMYAYDYTKGFYLLLFLSLLHVTLEFPLDWRVIRTLGAQLRPNIR